MKVPFGSGNITLEDICYKPLAPQKQKCTIQSLFQYFQDNRTSLNKCLTSTKRICNNYTLSFDWKAWDFHDHILSCTRYGMITIIIIIVIIIIVITVIIVITIEWDMCPLAFKEPLSSSGHCMHALLIQYIEWLSHSN